MNIYVYRTKIVISCLQAGLQNMCTILQKLALSPGLSAWSLTLSKWPAKSSDNAHL